MHVFDLNKKEGLVSSDECAACMFCCCLFEREREAGGERRIFSPLLVVPSYDQSPFDMDIDNVCLMEGSCDP